MSGSKVSPKKHRLTAEECRGELAKGIYRACQAHGVERVALEAGVVNSRTIREARDAKALLRLDFAVNLLSLEPTVLDELFGAIGYRLSPSHADPANDLNTIAGISHLAGEWIERLRDNHRCHRDTLALAAKIRPHLLALTAIVEEADRIKSGEAA